MGVDPEFIFFNYSQNTQPSEVGTEVGTKENNQINAFYYQCLTELFGGEGGIRTHEGLLTLAGFQDQCIQPLCHLS